ncbi:MAG TPA: DUF192 domain-containing protein [Acetobacteraceae bacterium]|nr:DUF192 domain-containing protein [Acetobacteraceae bacterium]
MHRRNLLLLLLAAPSLARGQEATIKGPQPKLPTEKLVIVTKDGKPHDFTVEVATTPHQQEVGEMFRKEVPPDQGMLFVWPAPHESPMWMKNTLVPLDMVFINPDGTIRAIAENTVPESLAPISSHGPVLAVLELAGGITARLNIVVGDKVQAKQFGSAG